MKKRNKKVVLLTGMLCALSLTVCACGSKKYEPAEVVAPEVQPLDTEEDAEEETPVTEQDMENEETDTEAEKEEAGSSAEAGNDENAADTEGTQENQSAAGGSPSPEEPNNTENTSDTESVQENQPAAQSASSEWVDSTPNLEGDAKDVQAGQFTVVEAVKQKSDNGGDIYVSAGSGDDSSYNKITVTYDENTLFAIRTIYDGGARSELSAATSASLSSGVQVQVWGTSSGGGLKATQICIIKVA